FGGAGGVDVGDRSGGEELERRVARRDRVHAVARRSREAQRTRGGAAVERECRAGERAGAERRERHARFEIAESLGIAAEHLDEREPVMGEPNRPRSLEMGVARAPRGEVTASTRRQYTLY